MSPDTNDILERDILPVLFPRAPTADRPDLVVLAGAPGVARRRAISRIASSAPHTATLLSADVLRAFHPEYLAAVRGQEPSTRDRVDAAATGWLQAALRYGTEHRRSIILDGSLSPEVTVAVGQQYRSAGYDTHLAILAAPASTALLSTLSSSADRVRRGQAGEVSSRATHDDGVGSISQLLSDASIEDAFTRIVVVGDRGDVVADGADSAHALVAFDTESRRGLSGMESATWLSELRRISEFALSQRNPPLDIVDALIELHQVALRDVAPNLPVPRQSEVIAVEEGRLAASRAALRRVVGREPNAAPAVPVVAGPDRGTGPSR